MKQLLPIDATSAAAENDVSVVQPEKSSNPKDVTSGALNDNKDVQP